MADNDTLKPMTDADLTAPPATTDFQPAAPLKDAAIDFESDAAAPGGTGSASRIDDARQTLRDNAGKLTQQAGDKARSYAEDGKARAGGALDELARMLSDAAGQVDERIGEQYGQYARSAAERVSSLSDGIKAKDIDELVEEARTFVRRSPGVAIGAAAAVGFVVARLLTSGLDQRHER